MKVYRDLNGDSGVTAYDYGSDWIHVQFKSGSVYEYTYASAGQINIEQMKRLADSGDGLNSFINKNVRKLFSRQI
jgi:hypothetical protein